MRIIFVVLFLLGCLPMNAQRCVEEYYAPNPGVQKAFVLYNNDSLLPVYELPNPLVFENGQKVTDTTMWWRQRRPEILSLFENEMYGKTPFFSQATTDFLQRPVVNVLSEKKDVFNGKATRKEVRLYYVKNDSNYYLDVLLYLPNRIKTQVPAYVMLNFRGNQSIIDDPDIRICSSWMTPRNDGTVVNFHSTEKSRGIAKSRWPIEMIIDRGYALATACYHQLVPDYESDFPDKAHSLFFRKGQTSSASNEWGSIGIWAWGMSRILDYLETESRINSQQVVAAGHSRLGKTALWAGAQDQRFAVVIANNSGCGGSALSKRIFGETIDLLCYVRPHWFCDNLKYYARNEKSLPIDQHELIALIAPRPVYLAVAEDDWPADPKGEYLSLLNADIVYQFLGSAGIGEKDRSNILLKKSSLIYDARMPIINHSTGETLGFHIRTGNHDVTKYDWVQFLNFTDKFF